MTFARICSGQWAERVGNHHAIITRSHYIGGYEWSILTPAPGRRVIASGWTKRMTDAAMRARQYFEGRTIIECAEDAALEAKWKAALR